MRAGVHVHDPDLAWGVADGGCFPCESHPQGHEISHVHGLRRTEGLRVGLSGEDVAITLALRQGRCVVVKVCGPLYVRWLNEHYPAASSKHGELCPPGSHGAPFHAILLIERRVDGYALYDPWFPASQQPFEMSEDAFQVCFAGEAVVALP